MVVRRAASACAMVVVSACSLVACALLVGPPDPQVVFPTQDASSSTVDVDVSSLIDASMDDQATGDATSEDETPRPIVDSSPMDVVPPGPCVVGPMDLITNGDFSEGGAGWSLITSAGTIIADAGPDQLCVDAPAGQSVQLAWTPGTSLDTGPALYSFTYCARTSEVGLTINAIVGHSVYPNMPVDYSGTDQATTTWPGAAFTHPVAGGNDDSAGLSFGFTSTVEQQVCFAAVSLTASTSDN